VRAASDGLTSAGSPGWAESPLLLAVITVGQSGAAAWRRGAAGAILEVMTDFAYARLLRPVTAADVPLLQRFSTEPGLVGLDWAGYRDPETIARRFGEDGYLGDEGGRLMVNDGTDESAAGFVSWRARKYVNVPHWEIGIALLPERRGQGLGWRAQALLCDYLFQHTPAWRIEAGTHEENLAEQHALEKAGFQLDGVVRAAEYRDGVYRNGYLYSRLRSDPAPRDPAPSLP
jgi:ribosomal-protein-alanine N-acetyltransferase